MDVRVLNSLKYTETHEWIKEEANEVTVGISDFAQSELGEIVFIELPEIGKEVNAKDECAVIESVKAASDIYAPVSGTVTAVNTAIEDNTGVINDDPYGKGWLFKIKPADPSELDALMTADEYIERIELGA